MKGVRMFSMLKTQLGQGIGAAEKPRVPFLLFRLGLILCLPNSAKRIYFNKKSDEVRGK